MNDVQASTELKRLLGERMAAKLIADCDKAAEEFANTLAELTHKTVEQRVSLSKDELNETRYIALQSLAIPVITRLILSNLSCRVLSLSCVLHAIEQHSMSSYIGHAAAHYEIELENRKAERIGGLLDVLLHSQGAADDEPGHETGRAPNSKN